MIQTFVKKLQERVIKERDTVVYTLSTMRNVSSERREAMVEKRLTLDQMLEWISELYKVGDDGLEDEEERQALREDVSKPASKSSKLSRRPAQRWG